MAEDALFVRRGFLGIRNGPCRLKHGLAHAGKRIRLGHHMRDCLGYAAGGTVTPVREAYDIAKADRTQD